MEKLEFVDKNPAAEGLVSVGVENGVTRENTTSIRMLRLQRLGPLTSTMTRTHMLT